MLTFKLINLENGFYHYEIYPEGNINDKGWIIFNPETKKLKERVSPKGPFSYINHFLSGVKDKNGNYKKEGVVAWH